MATVNGTLLSELIDLTGRYVWNGTAWVLASATDRTTDSADIVRAGDGNDVVYGGGGNDQLFGEAGDDILIGGAGSDKLDGGTGADHFVFTAVSDSAANASNGIDNNNADVIAAFTSVFDTADVSQRDRIDLSQLALNIGHSLTWSNTTPSSWGVWHTVSSNKTLVRIDTNGDGRADLIFKISSAETLSANDFIGLVGGDLVVPTVVSAACGANDGVLKAGESISISITFSEAVLVSGGPPTLSLSSAGVATYSSGSGTSTLTFTYLVGPGDSSPDLAVSAFNLNLAAIRDVAGNAADLTGAAINPDGIVVVDTITPSVLSAAYGPNDGLLTQGETVTFTVTFSEAVVVSDLSPTLSLSSGGVATYSGGSGTNTLTFTYVVSAGESSPDLAVAALNPNLATIRDAAGNDASLAGAAVNPAGILVVDAIAPTIQSAAYGTNDGTLTIGETVTLTLTFSDAVVVSGGTPSLALSSGSIATYSGGSGTDTLTFSYIVGPGESSPDLAIASLGLNGSSVADAAGNGADLAGGAVNPAGVLVVDTLAPTVTSAAAVNVAETQTFVTNITASDDNPAGLTFAITGGADAARFVIDAITGALSFAAAPDFEAPADADADNVYLVEVTVSDAAGLTGSQALAVTVTDFDETTAITITSGASAAIAENSGAGQAVYTATAESGVGGVTFSLKAGSDPGLSIDPGTGAVSLADDPDYETQASYQFTVVASNSAGNSDEQTVSLTIGNLDEVAPAITSGAVAAAIDENSGGSQLVYTATATDSEDISSGVTFSLKVGSDPGISIDAVTGEVQLEDSPNFESHPQYHFTVVAMDGAGNASEQAVSLAINDVDENRAPTLSDLKFTASGITFLAADPDTTPPDSTLSYSAPFASGFGSVVDGSLTTFAASQQAAAVAATLRVTDGGANPLGVDVAFIGLGTGAADTLNAGASLLRAGLFGFGGDDTLTGSGQDDYLSGGSGKDIITGGNGADVLFGGAAADTLNGGAGADIFVYTAALDSAALPTNGYDSTNADQVAAFTSIFDTSVIAEQDKIDLSGLAFNINHALTWSGTTASAWGVWYSISSGKTLVRVDSTGDGRADMIFRIATAETLSAADFILSAASPDGVSFDIPPDANVAPNRVSTFADAGAPVGIDASAVEPTLGDTITYSINDARFAIDPTSGVVTRSAIGSLDSVNEPAIVVSITATSSDGSTAQQNFTIAVSDFLYRYAVFGDFGDGETSGEQAIAAMVAGWDADFILTVGDNLYDEVPYDEALGQHYADYIGDYTGAYGPGSDVNRFFPTLGNHDYSEFGLQSYLDYFTLPDNERYYDFQIGSVHFFALNSNAPEPDGRTPGSLQAQWYEAAAAASQADFNVTFFHHTSFDSDGIATGDMLWDFENIGADAVFAGHEHSFYRTNRDDNGDNVDLPYITTGLGGRDPQLGASMVTVFEDGMLIEFYRPDGTLVDSYFVDKPAGGANLSQGNDDTMLGSAQADYLWGIRGNDTLNGLGGNDMLIGGEGDDTFIFTGSVGNDIVKDFAAGTATDDVLDLTAFGIETAQQFRAQAVDNAAGTVLTLSSGNTVQFEGVSESAFADDDFVSSGGAAAASSGVGFWDGLPAWAAFRGFAGHDFGWMNELSVLHADQMLF